MKRLRNAILSIFEGIYEQYASKWRNQRDGNALHAGMSLAGHGKILVVCVDKSGGVAHLVRCWRRVTQTSLHLALFYVCLSSPVDCEMKRELWDFAAAQARAAIGGRLEVFFAACERPPHLNCHAEIAAPVSEQCRTQLNAQNMLEKFRSMLEEPSLTR